MSSYSKVNGRPSRFNPTPLAKKMTSPEKPRDAWEQTKRNEGLPFPKTIPGHYNSRLSQRKPSQLPGQQFSTQAPQKEALLPGSRDINQPSLSGADGKTVAEVQPEVASPTLVQETPLAESEKEPPSESGKAVERNLGHVIKSLWRGMSSMFNTAPAVHPESSTDLLSDEVDAIKSRSLLLGEQTPNSSGAAKPQGQEERPAARLPVYLPRPRSQTAASRARLSRSISQSNDAVVAQLTASRATKWQKRDNDVFAFSDDRRASSSSSGALRKRKSPRRARSERQLRGGGGGGGGGGRGEDVAVRRERRVKERGSPVDSKKFRLVLKKFQKVLKEESKRLGAVRSDQSSLAINRAKSLVNDAEWGGRRTPHSQPGYGRKSLTSLMSPSGRCARELAGAGSSSALRKAGSGWRGERPARSAAVLDHGREFFPGEGIGSMSNTDMSAALGYLDGVRPAQQRSPYPRVINAQCAGSLSPGKSTVRSSPDGQRSFGREQAKDVSAASSARLAQMSQLPSPVSPVRNWETSDVDNPNESSSSV